MRERVAQVIIDAIVSQDEMEDTCRLGDDLLVPWLVQGEVDMGKVADAAIVVILAELETPSVEMVESVARVYNQTRWGAAINLSGETVYRPTAHDAMTAALQAVAAHLRKA